jgi:hypothetical protein
MHKIFFYPEDVVAQRLAPPVKSLIDFLKHSHARCQLDRHWNIFVEIDVHYGTAAAGEYI